MCQKIYIGPEPGDYYVLDEFQEFYLHEAFKKYKERCWLKSNNILVISDNDFKNVFNNYKNENIIVE